jgi:hypothetical protein
MRNFSEERVPNTSWRGAWVGLRAGLDVVGKKKSLLEIKPSQSLIIILIKQPSFPNA